MLHIDLSTPGLLESVSARWVRVRIVGLLKRPDSLIRGAMDALDFQRQDQAAKAAEQEGAPGDGSAA